ncbi:MAG: 16S rRNA (guanine(527)-N(7))-methyltransferase RsmG [Bacteroidales bacterium]|nr:16S rRNA (guanine(527)-N(7))-methyltransferase RsmG [Bacteroidales bacterium]
MEKIRKYFKKLTDTQIAQFEALDALYRDWNEKINVISRKDIDNLYEHHILHSLAIAKIIEFTPGSKILDVGTGGGFPGIPLAIMFPECQFLLVDRTGKKIKVAEDIVETSYSAFKLASNNLTNVNLQFSLGMVSALDVSNATYAKNEAEAQYNKSVRDLDLAVKSFAAKLFVNSKNSKFVLTDEIVYEDFNAVLETDTEKAINNRLDLYQLKSVYLQADRYTKVTILVGPTSAQHSDANQAKSTAEVNYNNAVTQTSLYINSVYNSVLDADDALSLAGENYSLRQKEYEIATLQYDLGMITNTQLVTYMNIATSAKLNLDNAKLTYLLAMKKYNYEIEIGLGL